jgi:uncharacterized protein (DUF342 family)
VPNENKNGMLFEAANIEEAIIKAEKHYKCGRKALRVYTLKPPISFLWGAIRKPGIYRIEKLHREKMEAVSAFRPVDGTVEIIGGLIKVKDPVNGGRYPSIIVNDPNIDVYINNKKAVGPCVVTEKDWINVVAKVVEPKIRIDVKLSRDRMEAILEVEKIPGRKYFLRDAEACNTLFICGDYKEIQPPDVSLKQCVDELVNKGVAPEIIQMDRIRDLLELPHGGSCVVAKGVPPVHGINSCIKYYFSQHSYRNPNLDMDGRVDIMDHTVIPTVKVGDVLAEKLISAIPGKDGMTVTGEPVKAKPGKELIFKAGKGTILLDDKKIIAAISGRPVLYKGIVSVMPILTIAGDVDVDTGNIRFDGDVVIRGNVKEGLRVTAGGNVLIGGNCYHAVIRAGGSIRIWGKVINCKVSAGVDMIMHLFVIPAIGNIKHILSTVVERIASAYPSRLERGVGHMVYTILNESKKLKKLVEDMENMLLYTESEDAERASAVISKIKKELFGTNALHIRTLDQIKEICAFLEEQEDLLRKRHIASTNITLEYCENSVIQCSGSITVMGRGSYRSNLIAKNHILQKRADGVVIGGALVAGKMIKAGIVGSTAGIKTYCRILDADGSFKATQCHLNTIIRVGEQVTTY